MERLGTLGLCLRDAPHPGPLPVSEQRSRWKDDGQGVGAGAAPTGRCQVHKQNKDTMFVQCRVPGLVLELPNTWRWLLQKVCGALGTPVLVLQGETPRG